MHGPKIDVQHQIYFDLPDEQQVHYIDKNAVEASNHFLHEQAH
jgi:hypothetical protein